MQNKIKSTNGFYFQEIQQTVTNNFYFSSEPIFGGKLARWQISR